MRNYLAVLGDVYHTGEFRMGGATGRLPTFSVFQRHLQFDLSLGFPSLTTRRLAIDVPLSALCDQFVEKDNAAFWAFVAQLADAPALGQSRLFTIDDVHGESTRLQVYPKRLLLHERMSLHYKKTFLQEEFVSAPREKITSLSERLDMSDVPRFRLDAALYYPEQDVYNDTPDDIAFGALLLTYLAHKTKMLPGVYTHLMGDVYCRDSDKKEISEQLKSEPTLLPTLVVDTWTTEGVSLKV